MDVKKEEMTIVAKPVASRPSCSNFRSFSELLAGAINASPTTATSSESTVPAIRPKTVRFTPPVHREASGLVSSPVGISGKAACDWEAKTSVVYKPLAKVVSKTTVSLLATMGKFNQKSPQPMQSKPQPPPQEVAAYVPPKRAPSTSTHSQENDMKSPASLPSSDRPSYDGYNWRKYGQKQVKGSEFPRSYYKCTNPSCPVKKKVERSLDGTIAEIVYKGEHNHSKPQPAKRGSSADQDVKTQSFHYGQRNEGTQGRVDGQNEVGLSPAAHDSHAGLGGGALQPYGYLLAATTGNDSNDNGVMGAEAEEGRKGSEAEEHCEPRNTKRRKSENQLSEAAGSSIESKVVVHNSADLEVSGDGFRWRKYGQKVVKGNPYPRSYYRCTSVKCNVRKHVERASDDPGAFVTTYEGKHNHEKP